MAKTYDELMAEIRDGWTADEHILAAAAQAYFARVPAEIAELDEDDQNAFLDGLRTLLHDSPDAGYAQGIEDYLADWGATAQTWADPELREALLDDADEPLDDVEL